MLFADRYDAARQLAPLLDRYKEEVGVVLAVPRGGVPIGYYLAQYLHFTLDLLMSKKIGHPLQKEFAIGAVGLRDSIVEEVRDVTEDYIVNQISDIREQLKKRYRKFMGKEEPADIRGKVVIVTDDGVATGRTILATLKMLHNQQPQKLVVAVPVASRQAAARIGQEVDEFICLYTPSPFHGVGNFYEDFSQTTDKEVIRLLEELKKKEEHPHG